MDAPFLDLGMTEFTYYEQCWGEWLQHQRKLPSASITGCSGEYGWLNWHSPIVAERATSNALTDVTRAVVRSDPPPLSTM
jgi:hypothetical protein